MEINKIKITQYRYWVECECGVKVYGTSESHVRSNYKIHKKSRKCKNNIQLKKEVENK